MSDLVSTMVPFSCMNPQFGDLMLKACNTVHAFTVVSDLHLKAQGFSVLANLCRKTPARGPLATPGALPLSQSFMANGPIVRTITGLQPNMGSATSRPISRIVGLFWKASHEERTLFNSRSMRRRVSAAGHEWGIEEDTVVLRCIRYTTGVLLSCAALVVGGLLAGFLVGSRIDGVDPFNLTMFSWVIAAFVMVVAKSLRVGEWSWKDFLQGRARCRSVSELAGITGLDEQSIIMHLLSTEDETPIVTKGPFNRVFTRMHGDADGFSIDAKPTIGTLAISGILVLEVLAEWGPALICLDLRPQNSRQWGSSRWWGSTIPGDDVGQSRRRVHSQRKLVQALACKDPPNETERDKDIVFQMQSIRWEKIVGVYNDTERRVW